MKFFLLSLKHGYVGNSHLWWRPKCAGYTCDLNQAGLYTREDMTDIQLGYDTHAVPEEEARALAESHVTDATGGLLKYHEARRKNAPKPPPRKRERCHQCGVFMKPLTSPEGLCRRCMDEVYA